MEDTTRKQAAYHTSLGDELYEQGDVVGAIRAYCDATRLDPDYSEASLRRGIAYLRIGYIDYAIEHLQKAISLCPDDHSAMPFL